MAPKRHAFTLIEVMAALAVVAIAMVALIRMHGISINLTDRTDLHTHAILLAQEKIAQTLALGYPPIGVNDGSVRRAGGDFHWQTEVADLHTGRLDGKEVTPLRNLVVQVAWHRHSDANSVRLNTYVANAKIP